MNFLFSGGNIGDRLNSWPLWAQILTIAVAVIIVGCGLIYVAIMSSEPPEKHL